MKSNNLAFVILLLAAGFPFFVQAQVGIGTTSPNGSSILELSATDKGLLIPRLSTTQRNSIVGPATGLQIYNLDDGCTDNYDGVNWMKNCPMKQIGMGDSTGTNQWVKKADFANGLQRERAVGFSIGAKGYVGTGFSTDTYFKDFWEYNPVNNTWAQKADFGGLARELAVGFSLSGKGYIGTGKSGAATYYKDFWEYDPAANTWTQKADFGGVARNRAIGFAANGKAYIGTGYTGSANLQDFWEYDPITNIWSSKANFPGGLRRDAVGFSIGNKGYAGTGVNLLTNYADFWEYDPLTNVWSSRASFSGTARRNAVGFSVGNKGFVGTGFNGTTISYSDIWEYDPVSNTWLQKADFSGGPRQYSVGFGIGSKAYLGCGIQSGVVSFSDFWEYTPGVLAPVYSQSLPSGGISSLNDGAWTLKNNQVFNSNSGGVGIGTGTPDKSALLELNSSSRGLLLPRMSTDQRNGITDPAMGLVIFNTSDGCTDTYDGTYWMKNCPMKQSGTGDSTGTNQWERKNDFANGLTRFSAVGFSIADKGYVGTGNSNGTFFKDLWQYNPTTNTWTQKADFGGVARVDAVGFSIGTKGYIGTGYTGSAYLLDFWEYDPAGNTWMQKANFGGPARGLAIGFEVNGKGYVGTGSNGASELNDFWEYNPVSNGWSSKANYPGGQRHGVAGFSIGTKGYAGTGAHLGVLYADFYSYDPTTNTWQARASFPGTARVYAVGLSIGNKGYIGTGLTLPNASKDFWEYDPDLNNWTQKANCSAISRYRAVGFSIGSKGYLCAGGGDDNNAFLSDFWQYTPSVSAPTYAQPVPAGGIASLNDGAWTLQQNQLFNSNTGNVGIGTNAPAPSAQLEVSSTTSGFLMPRMTTTQRDAIYAPEKGLLIFNTTQNQFNVRSTSDWETLFDNKVGMNGIGINVAVGNNALLDLSDGISNTAIGNNALDANTSGDYNAALGVSAGGTTTTGNYNTFIGYTAYAASGAATFSNMTALGYNARPSVSNTIRFGNSSITDVEAYAPYTDISDGRFKRDVQANVPGLDFIRRLRPVTYHLDVNAISEQLQEDYQPDSTGQFTKVEPDAFTLSSRRQKSAVLNTGFIAQEVEAAAREIGFDFFGVDRPKNEQDFYGLRYAQFTVPLVKAVQELETQNKALDERNTALEKQNEALMADITQLKTAQKAQEAALNQVKMQLEALGQKGTKNE